MAAGRIVLALVASLAVGAGVGAGVGAFNNIVRPAAIDDTRETEGIPGDPASAPGTASEPVDPADPEQWVIGFHSIGPVEVGNSVAAARAEFSLFDAQPVDGYCTWTNWFYRPDMTVALILTQDESAVELIDISNRGTNTRVGPRTAGGIGLGSTLDELMAAHPDAVYTGDYGPEYVYYGITDGSGWIVFAVETAGISRITVGAYDTMASEYCG